METEVFNKSAEAVPWLIIVAAIWGVTNPFIKQGSRGIENINENNKFQQFVAELLFLFGNWKYLLPFSINQFGSLLYYFTLSTTDLTLVVPITNSLTLIFTSLTARILGEKAESWETLLGLVLVVCGVIICFYSKS